MTDEQLVSAGYDIVVGRQYGSPVLLSRLLDVPIERALQLLTELQALGVVGEASGIDPESDPWPVLIDRSGLPKALAS